MRINDYVRLARAKLRDINLKYSPRGANERVERDAIEMETSDIKSERFQKALDDLWLYSRELVNCNKEQARKIRELRKGFIEREGEDPTRDEIFLDSAQSLDEIAEEREKWSEAIKQFRDRCYAFVRGEISREELGGHIYGIKLPGVQNAN